MKEKLHHKIPVVRELPLEAFNALNPHRILCICHSVIKLSFDHLIHPAGIQKLKLSGLRNSGKMAAEKRLSLLLHGRLLHRGHLKEAGINVSDDLPDDKSLARGSPALHQHQDGQLLLLHLHLLLHEPVSGRRRADISSSCGFSVPFHSFSMYGTFFLSRRKLFFK